MKVRIATTVTVALMGASGGALALAAEGKPPADVPKAPAASPSADAAEGSPASEVGQERRAAAMSFVEAKKAWTTCVAEAAAAHEPGEPFSPTDACGDRPKPTLPEQAADGGKPDDLPRLPEQASGGRPDDVPPGPPADVPAGPPADLPAGPPAEGPAVDHGQVPSDPGSQGLDRAPGGRP